MKRRTEHQDSGAALIMAIGFVLMVGAIGAGLAGIATTSLNDRSNLEAVRNREYAADGAVEEAVARVRAVQSCTPSSGSIVDSSIVATGITVDWLTVCPAVTTSDATTSYNQRNVIFSACEGTVTPCDPAKVIVRAQVNFEPAAGPVTKTYIQSWSVKR